MKSSTKILLVVGSLAIVGVCAYVVTKKKSDKPSDADFNDMITASNESGSDSFEGLTLAQVKERFKNANVTDVRNAAAIFKKKKAGTLVEEDDKALINIFSRATGVTIKS